MNKYNPNEHYTDKSMFTDERGTIQDCLVNKSVDAVTHITFNPGAVRGNHYHKETIQYDYILKGKLWCYQGRWTTIKGKKVLQVIAGIVGPKQLIVHMKGIPHAYKAIEYSEIITCTKGPRKGTDYSKDTYKLIEPLFTPDEPGSTPPEDYPVLFDYKL